jgi:hypothetical protein
MRILSIVLLIALNIVGIMQPAHADDPCFRVTIYFNADEDINLRGKLGVRYTDGNTTRFADFHFDPQREIEAGDRERIGSFTVLDMDEIDVSLNDNEVFGDGEIDFDVDVDDCDAPRSLDDGRLNRNEIGAVSIVYKNNLGGFDIYRVHPTTGDGQLAIRVAGDAVAAALVEATAPDSVNTLIALDGEISFWALTSNECLVKTFLADGKSDDFVFPCASN